MAEIKDGLDQQDTRLSVDTPEENQEHVKAALDKAEAGLGSSKTLLAGKFENTDELLKGIVNALQKTGDQSFLESVYKELERRIGAPPEKRPTEFKAPEAPKQETGKTEDSDKDDSDSDDSEQTEIPREDLLEIGAEFNAKGQLSDKSYAKLEALGYDRATVDTYLDGVRYRLSQMYDRVGGESNYRSMIQWAAQNLPKHEQEAFDAAIRDDRARYLAIDGLWRRYTEAGGAPPRRLHSPNQSSSFANTSGFASREQFLAALRDPRYKTDPAYREEVMQRLAVSKL